MYLCFAKVIRTQYTLSYHALEVKVLYWLTLRTTTVNGGS